MRWVVGVGNECEEAEFIVRHGELPIGSGGAANGGGVCTKRLRTTTAQSGHWLRLSERRTMFCSDNWQNPLRGYCG